MTSKPTADLRILGVNINDQLSFTKHISDICKKASRKIGVLARLRNLVSCKTKLKLYTKLYVIFVSNLRGESWRDSKNALEEQFGTSRQTLTKIFYAVQTCPLSTIRGFKR